MIGNPSDRSFHIVFQANTQPRFNGLITGYRVGEFVGSFIENPEIHAG